MYPPMRIFKTKTFARWAQDEGLGDAALKNAIDEMQDGLVDASLGGKVYKKRVATGNKGKSGGLRTLIAYQDENRAVFMFGFAKNERANIDKVELKALKRTAQILLEKSDATIKIDLQAKELIEVK